MPFGLNKILCFKATSMASENGEFQHDWSYISVGGGVSFVMALCVFRFIGPAMSSRYTTSYSSLSKAAKADWGDR